MMAGGQSINDRLTAARYSIAGQGLAKSVCKATTEEVIGPKKKHLDYLLHCTNEPNVSIPQLANLLIERTGHSSWVVVFKALVTVHHLMCYGNERFTQYLASSNSSFQLGNFLDKSNVQGYDMSTFIRRYAKYLNEKALSYRTVAFDFCKIKRGKDDGILRTMNADKLLKTLPVLQSQIDALLEFDCTANELTNGIINSAFMLLFRDLIRLFACYNDGIINLLEKYFDMNKKMCRDALDIYKKFLIRMDRVAEFLKVAENVGIDKGDIPDLAKAPSSLLDALEQHLTALEGKKGSGAGTPTQPTVKPSYLNSAVTALSNTSSSFGSAAAGGRSEFNGVGMDDTVKKFALEEEQAALTQHRERRMKELAAQSPTEVPSGANTTNPFLTSPTSQEPVLDIFDSLPTSSPSTKTSDDLLCLKSNPFAESIINTSQAPPPSPFPNDFWGNQNGFTVSNAELTTSVSSSNIFVSDAAFDTVFGNNNNASTSGTTLTPVPAPGFDALGDVLQPVSSTAQSSNQSNQGKMTATSKVITGDLDSSLAILAQNLDINRGASSLQKGGHVWNSPKNTTKTGGANWTPHIASSTASWNSPQHNFKPMSGMSGTAPTAGPGKADWSSGITSGFPPTMMQPQSTQFMGGPRPVGTTPNMNVTGGPMGMGMPAGVPLSGIGQQSMFGAMHPTQPAAFGVPPTQPQSQTTTLDPFGVL